MYSTELLVRHVPQTYELRAVIVREARMPSGNRFSQPGIVREGDIYEVFSSLGQKVLTTSEIDEEINWASNSTVRRQLKKMTKSGELRSKKAGENQNAGIVWYLPDEFEKIPQPTPDPIKLVYQHPWFSLVAGGLLFTGIGFTLFMPGFFGDGLYLGLISRELIVLISIALYSFGVSMISAGSILIIGSTVMTAVRNRLD